LVYNIKYSGMDLTYDVHDDYWDYKSMDQLLLYAVQVDEIRSVLYEIVHWLDSAWLLLELIHITESYWKSIVQPQPYVQSYCSSYT